MDELALELGGVDDGPWGDEVFGHGEPDACGAGIASREGARCLEGCFVALFDGGADGGDVLGLEYDLAVVGGVSFAYTCCEHVGVAVARDLVEGGGGDLCEAASP